MWPYRPRLEAMVDKMDVAIEKKKKRKGKEEERGPLDGRCIVLCTVVFIRYVVMVVCWCNRLLCAQRKDRGKGRGETIALRLIVSFESYN